MDIKDYEIEHREALVNDFTDAYELEWEDYVEKQVWEYGDCEVEEFATNHPNYWAFVTERYSTQGE